MINLKDVESQDAYRRDLLRHAETERLAQAARGELTAFPVYRPLMSWTGRRLMGLGFRLLVMSKEWEQRANTVYNGAEVFLTEPISK
jgi:hypothetical protein